MPEVKSIDELYQDLLKRNSQPKTPPLLGSYDSSINSSGKIDFSEITPYKRSSVYDTLSSGAEVARYKNFIPGTNNEERLAQQQTTWDKWSNGLTKFGAKTLNAVVGGTAGVVYGLGSAVSDGKWSSIYNNDFSNWLGDLDTKVNYNLPNYYTEQEKQLGLGGQMMTSNFWTDKFLGGLSFTTGAIVSEGIWAWATGGTSLASTGARWGAKLARLRWGVEATEDTAKVLQAMSKYKSLYKELPGEVIDLAYSDKIVDYAIKGGKAGELTNLARFTATSAGYEASVEALQFRKEAEEKFFNRETPPTPEETAEFYKNLESASNGVFWTNMAIVGSSNLVTMGNIFGLKSPIKTGVSEFIERKAFGLGIDKATNEVIKQTGKQKAAKISYEYLLKPALTEGLYEEGFQGVTTKVANKWMEHTYDPKKSLESFDMMSSVADSMAEQYGTKEGWVENGLGMIIGIVGGSINARSGIKAEQKELEYKANVAKTFDQASLQAQILPERLKMMNQINGFNQEAQVEAKKGNIVKSQLAQNDSILSYINAKNSLGDSVSDITKEVGNAMEAITSEQWKDAGIENVEDYKKETLSEFERIAKSYEKNKTFWSYIVGKKLVGEENLDQGVLAKEAFGNLSPNQLMVESLTWASVRGENASKYMNDIQEVLSSELGAQNGKLTYTLSQLSGATGGLKTQLNKNLALHDSLLKEREVLEKAILKLQNAPKETEGQATQKVQYSTLANKLVTVNEKIQNIQNALEDIAEKVNQTRNTQTAFKDIDLKGDLSGQKITAEDLIKLKENVQKLQQTLDFLVESDPQRGEYLQDLMKEYQDANDILLAHQASLRMAQKAKLSDINTWVGAKFLKKGKAMNQDSMEWFNEMANMYAKSKAGIINQEYSTPQEENVETPEEKEPTAPNQVAPIIETVEEKKPTLLDEYKKRIEQLYKGKYYLARYLGDNVEELGKDKPSPQDIERYRELSKQPEETQELIDLRNKLQNWKLLDTAIDDNGMSIAEMIDIVNQQEQETEKEDTKTEVTEEDVEEIMFNASEDNADNSFLQNQNGSVTAKLMPNGNIRFSHLKLSTIADRFGAEKEAKKADIERRRQEELDSTNLYEYDRKFKEFQTYGSTVKEAFDNLFEEVKNNPTNKELSDLLDYINDRLVNEDIQKGSSKNPLVQEYIDENQQSIEKASKSDKSRIGKINAKYDAELDALESNQNTKYSAEILDKDGKVVTSEDIDSTITSLKEGEEAVYTINGITFTVDEKGRISMRYTAFIANQDAMNMYLINPNSTKWTYKNIYEFNGEDTVKLPSDFQEEISAKDILDLKEGDEVQFVINSKDGFNDNKLKGISEQEQVRKLKIGVVKNGKFIGILKAGTEDTEQVLLSLREQAYAEFKKGNKSKVVGKTKVDKVYLGSPAIKMNNQGQTVNIPITQEAKTVIKATGFLEEGKITTNITIAENTLNTSFVREEQGKKSPFIVFQVGSQMVAYPVTMARTKDSKLDELENALNKQTVQEQVLAVNDLIQQFNIQTEKVFPETLESRLEELKKAFDEHTTFVSAEQFASAEYNTDNITKDALINIDLEIDVFEDPKVKISLDEEDMKVLVSADFKNMSKTDIENELSDLAVELDRDYRVNADTKYLYAKGSKVGQIIEDTKYTNTFDDTPPVKPTSQLDKIRNMNILREALSERLPFEIKQIIGEEKLKEIDKMFKMYDNIIKKQLEVDKSQEENGNSKICS